MVRHLMLGVGLFLFPVKNVVFGKRAVRMTTVYTFHIFLVISPLEENRTVINNHLAKFLN